MKKILILLSFLPACASLKKNPCYIKNRYLRARSHQLLLMGNSMVDSIYAQPATLEGNERQRLFAKRQDSFYLESLKLSPCSPTKK